MLFITLKKVARPLALIIMFSAYIVSANQALAEPRWYGGGSLGYTAYDNENLEHDLDENLTPGTSTLRDGRIPLHFFFGYRYNQYLGLEGGYQYLDEQKGKTTLDAQSDLSAETLREIDGFLFGVKGFIPVNKLYSLQVSGGYYLWHLDTSVNSISSGGGVSLKFDKRKSTPYAAIEIHRVITNQTSLFGQWLRLDIDNDTANVINLGIMHYLSANTD